MVTLSVPQRPGNTSRQAPSPRQKLHSAVAKAKRATHRAGTSHMAMAAQVGAAEAVRRSHQLWRLAGKLVHEAPASEQAMMNYTLKAMPKRRRQKRRAPGSKAGATSSQHKKTAGILEKMSMFAGSPLTEALASAREDSWDTNTRLIGEARELLKSKVNVDVKMGDESCTPLHRVCRRGNRRFAHLLQEHGADPNELDSRGRTPLHFAASNGHVEVVDLLLRRGARVNQLDAEDRSPLFAALAAGQSEMVALLVNNGAVLSHKKKVGDMQQRRLITEVDAKGAFGAETFLPMVFSFVRHQFWEKAEKTLAKSSNRCKRIQDESRKAVQDAHNAVRHRERKQKAAKRERRRSVHVALGPNMMNMAALTAGAKKGHHQASPMESMPSFSKSAGAAEGDEARRRQSQHSAAANFIHCQLASATRAAAQEVEHVKEQWKEADVAEKTRLPDRHPLHKYGDFSHRGKVAADKVQVRVGDVCRRMTAALAAEPLYRGSWQVMFASFDSDGSGTISLGELYTALRELLSIPQTTIKDVELKVLWSLADDDGSGELEFDEFEAFVTKYAAMAAAPVAATPRGARAPVPGAKSAKKGGKKGRLSVRSGVKKNKAPRQIRVGGGAAGGPRRGKMDVLSMSALADEASTTKEMASMARRVTQTLVKDKSPEPDGAIPEDLPDWRARCGAAAADDDDDTVSSMGSQPSMVPIGRGESLMADAMAARVLQQRALAGKEDRARSAKEAEADGGIPEDLPDGGYGDGGDGDGDDDNETVSSIGSMSHAGLHALPQRGESLMAGRPAKPVEGMQLVPSGKNRDLARPTGPERAPADFFAHRGSAEGGQQPVPSPMGRAGGENSFRQEKGRPLSADFLASFAPEDLEDDMADTSMAPLQDDNFATWPNPASDGPSAVRPAWPPAQSIASALASIGLSKYAPALEAVGADHDALLLMNAADYKSCGVPRAACAKIKAWVLQQRPSLSLLAGYEGGEPALSPADSQRSLSSYGTQYTNASWAANTVGTLGTMNTMGSINTIGSMRSEWTTATGGSEWTAGTGGSEWTAASALTADTGSGAVYMRRRPRRKKKSGIGLSTPYGAWKAPLEPRRNKGRVKHLRIATQHGAVSLGSDGIRFSPVRPANVSPKGAARPQVPPEFRAQRAFH